MAILYKNNAASTLASGIASGATSLTVATGHGARFPTVSGSDYFYVTIISASDPTVFEIVKCTGRSGDVLTIVRAQESTTAAAWSANDRVEQRITAAMLSDALGERLALTGGTLTGASTVSVSTWEKWTLETTGVTAKARQGSDTNGLNFTSNARWTGSAWAEDDSTRKKFAYIQHLGNGRHEFRTSPTGAGVSWTTSLTVDETAVNSTVALTQGGNQVLHAGNYNSYSPTLTGTGASGSWGISITGSSASATGNAATATTLQTARTINGTSFNGSANITTASWGTARTLTIGATGKSVDGSGNVSWTLAEIGAPSTTDAMISRGSVATASVDTATLNGFYTQSNVGDSDGLLVFNSGGSLGPLQMYFKYSGIFQWRNKTDSTTWTAWKTVLHSANYTSYSPSLTGTGASGTWGISITGNAATATSATDSTKLPLSGGTLTGTLYFTDTTNGLSKSGGRLTVRSESTDNVANFAGYGLYLPVSGATAGLYVESPIEARSGLRIGNGAGSGTITVGADTSETASRLVQRDSSGGIFGTYIRARKNQTAGDYTTAALWTESYGNTATGVAFHISGNVGKFLEMRTNGILYWNGDTVIHSGNYSSYALPLSGGTVSGQTRFTGNDNQVIIDGTTNGASSAAGLFFALQGALRWENYHYNGALRWYNYTNTSEDFSINNSSSVANFRLTPTVGGSAVLHAANYNSYSPTLTGGGASGTWGISITGNAATATSATDSTKLPLSGGTLTGLLTMSGFANPHFTVTTSGGDYSYIRLWDGSSSGYLIKNVSSGTGNGMLAGSLYLYTDQNKPVQIVHAGTSNATFLSGGDVYVRGQIYAAGNGASTGSQVLHAGNYTSYSPSLGGSGASGTWGINITGNADTVDSLHASSFSRKDTTNQWIKPYYEYGSYLTGETPANLRDQMGGGGLRVDFLHPSYTGSGGWNHVITWSGYNVYNMYQLGGHYDGGTGTDLWVRSEANHTGTSWTAWRKLLNSSNYNSYAPSLTGSGASGTWSINITGNAAGLSGGATINNANFNGIMQFPSGASGATFGANHYSMGKDIANGGWSHPHYSDLIIGYHTGIRIGAAYSGIRFYNNSPTTDANNDGNGDQGEALLMTIGGHAAGSGVIVNNSLTAYGSVSANDVYTTGGWFRNHTNNNGIYWSATGWHLYPASASDFYVRSGTSSGSLLFLNSGGSGLGYLHCASDSAMGFLTSGGSWRFRVDNSGNARCYNNLYLDQNYGHGIVGVYASTRYQGVFAMGDSYKLPADGTTTGSLYGLAWSHPNTGGAAGNLDSHGLLVLINGGFGSAMSYSIVASGNVTAYSDERLKTNWREMPTNFVERLAAVRVGIYDRTDGERITQVGVSAQSLRTLLPEAVNEAKDDMKTLSVTYGNAAMASAVELAKEIVKLRMELDELKSKLN